MIKIFVHVALAFLAFVVFWLGVVADLEGHSTIGRFLLIAAPILFFGNIAWAYFSVKWWRK